jgi:hypothetical protein
MTEERTIVVRFNSALIKILNLTEKLQIRLYGKADSEFKSQRLKLSTAIQVNFNLVINYLGPILEKHREIVESGNIEQIFTLDFTQYADNNSNRDLIEKNTIQSHQLFFIATPEEKADLVKQAQNMLKEYTEYLNYKK